MICHPPWLQAFAAAAVRHRNLVATSVCFCSSFYLDLRAATQHQHVMHMLTALQVCTRLPSTTYLTLSYHHYLLDPLISISKTPAGSQATLCCSPHHASKRCCLPAGGVVLGAVIAASRHARVPLLHAAVLRCALLDLGTTSTHSHLPLTGMFAHPCVALGVCAFAHCV